VHLASYLSGNTRKHSTARLPRNTSRPSAASSTVTSQHSYLAKQAGSVQLATLLPANAKCDVWHYAGTQLSTVTHSFLFAKGCWRIYKLTNELKETTSYFTFHWIFKFLLKYFIWWLSIKGKKNLKHKLGQLGKDIMFCGSSFCKNVQEIFESWGTSYSSSSSSSSNLSAKSTASPTTLWLHSNADAIHWIFSRSRHSRRTVTEG